MILPKTDITILSVRNAIGYPSTDLGTLCGGTPESAARINRWSKYKPVRKNFTFDRPSDWWKADDGRCGLNIVSYSSIGSLNTEGSFLYRLVRQLDKWEYKPPTGGSTSPFRLGDYAGYNSNAIPPVSATSQEEFYISGNTLQIDFDLAVPTGSDNNLTLSDFEIGGVSLARYYMGAVLFKGGSTYKIGTSDKALGTMGCSMTLDGFTSSHVGVWSLYTFLSKDSFSSTGGVQSSSLVCFPLPPIKINIKDQGTLVQIYCVGVWTDISRSRIRFNFVVDNDGSSAVTVSGIRAIVNRTRGTQEASSGEYVTEYKYPGSIYVPARSSVTSDPIEIAVKQQSGYDYWIAGLASTPADIKTSYTPVEDVEQEPIMI